MVDRKVYYSKIERTVYELDRRDIEYAIRNYMKDQYEIKPGGNWSFEWAWDGDTDELSVVITQRYHTHEIEAEAQDE